MEIHYGRTEQTHAPPQSNGIKSIVAPSAGIQGAWLIAPIKKFKQKFK
jgi:hypothetical protein